MSITSTSLKPMFCQLVCTKELADPKYYDISCIKSFSNGERTGYVPQLKRKVSFDTVLKVWVLD